MIKTRVIPCLLLKDGGLVKTVKFSNPVYIGDPINAVKIFNEKEVDELVLLDTVVEGRGPSIKLISEIAGECFMPLGYGGGVRSIEDIREIFNLGVEKIIINSYAVENPIFIKQAAKIFGSQSIIVSIDVKKENGKDKIFIHNGKKETGLNPVEFTIKIAEMGAGEILLTSINRDGTMDGYDVELIKKVSKAVNIPVIASGGAGKLEDFASAVESGASAVAAGSMFVFYGSNHAVLINYPSQTELKKFLD